MYEAEGVLLSARRNSRRYYSSDDIRWVKCIRVLLHREGLSLHGVRSLLASVSC